MSETLEIALVVMTSSVTGYYMYKIYDLYKSRKTKSILSADQTAIDKAQRAARAKIRK